MTAFDPAALTATLQHTETALFALRPDGTITAAEGAALRWLSDRTFAQRTLQSLAEQPEQIAALLAQASQGVPASARLRILNAATNYVVDADTGNLIAPQTATVGSRIWAITITALASGLYAIVNDLTDQIEAEAARDEMIKGLRALLWHADIDATGSSLSWNFRPINEDFGPSLLPLNVTPGQTWGQAWVASRHPEDNERMNRASTRALMSGAESYQQIFRCYAADGSLRWFREEVQISHLAPGRWRLVGICSDITALQLQEQRLREFQLLADNALDAIMIFTTAGRIRYANPVAAHQLAYPNPGAMLGKHVRALIHNDQTPNLLDQILPHLSNGWSGEAVLRRADGSDWLTRSSVFLLLDTNGVELASAVIASDLSAQRRAELERQELQDELIQTQRDTLRELSTPLIPLADGMIAMPLVGAIDSARAQQIMETLLEGIARLQAETAIVDITGVRMVDTQVADSLLRVARAAQLLGAQVILTGISPEVAQSLVQLGSDLRGIVTLNNLQAGIAYGLRQRRA